MSGAEILGTANVKAPISKSTFTIKAYDGPSAGSVGVESPMTRSNGSARRDGRVDKRM